MSRLLYGVGARPEWHERAPCRGQTALFFPEGSGNRHRHHEARAICQACPLAEPCLEYALSLPHPWHGIYAGLTPRQRHKLHKDTP